MQKVNKLQMLLLSCFALLSPKVWSQQTLDNYLNAVEKNNASIQKFKEQKNMLIWEAKTGLTPENPEFEYGYFPGNTSDIGVKKVMGVSQSFSFPTTYSHQNKVSKKQIAIINNTYEKHALNILKQAKIAWTQAAFLNKKLQIFSERLSDAETLYKSYVKKLENGDATQLEVNKAKLFKLNWQNYTRLISTEIQQNQQLINLLNGGNTFVVNDTIFTEQHLESWEDIKGELFKFHPDLNETTLEKELSQAELKLEKSNNFPSFSLGYEQEVIADEAFRGIKTGISLPLWQNKNTIKHAKAKQAFTYASAQETTQKIESDYYKRYLKTKALADNFKVFKSELDKMNNTHLLQRSLELGQISSIQYFMELDYFYGVYNELLELELAYQLSVIDLLDFKK